MIMILFIIAEEKCQETLSPIPATPIVAVTWNNTLCRSDRLFTTGQKGIPLVTSDGTLRMVVFVPVEVPDLVQIELTIDEK